MKKLTEYNFPEDLKNMSEKEMELLAIQIREFLIDKVSATGGHVASNLGVVELSIALHKVFDSPKDKIIWDVGHQAYVHKILTGRAEGFDTLRQFGGMSGFPKAKESEHDIFDTGHSTTSLSLACGMAAARDIKGEKHEVVAVIGDGSLTGGMAYEAMDNLGFKKNKVIIILNDNGMSISKNVGGISKYLGAIRTSQGYRSAKKFVKDKVDTTKAGHGIAQGLASFKNDLKYTMMNNPGVFFENLGMTYLGPIDGHDIKQIITALNKARSLDEPVVIHCLTKKGKGYSIAEKYPRKFHGIGPFDPVTGEVLKKSPNPSFSKVMGKHLIEMARKDEKIVAITAAMGEATGLMDISLEIPERYFDVGIAEEHGVTFAAGLAKAGLKPMVCIYSSFLQRAYDQLMEDVCLQNLHVVFLLDRAGVVGADGETHHGIFDLSYLNTMPNMTVLAPKNGEELEKMMDWAAEQDGPVAIRYPRGEAVCDNEVMSTKYDAPGSFRVFSGKEIDIWTLGKMYDTAHEVRKILESKGYKCGLVDVNMAKPLDVSVYDTNARYVISIEDNIVTGGFGDILCKALMDRNCKVIRYGWPDTFVTHGTFEQLADMYGLSPEKIADSILKHIASDKKRGGLFG
ncbi:MAG: 1-deoxy-D-xylulose-5-phosphate synthase [Firmicutes bacterium]|nr:1-deoxy-D-xylulose-5-phosphate synthase [Bacillota bacterium]